MFKEKLMVVVLAIFMQVTITYGEDVLGIGKSILKGALGGDQDAQKDKKDGTKDSTDKNDSQINIDQIDLNKFSELKKKAATGDSDALYVVGLVLLEGNKSIDKNIKDALVYLNKAAEKNSDAQYTLGALLYSGKNVKKDIDKGKDLLIQSAKSGNDKAVNYLIKQNIIKDKSELADKTKDNSKTVQSEERQNISKDEDKPNKSSDVSTSNTKKDASSDSKQNDPDEIYANALKEVTDKANKGDPESQYKLGYLLLVGDASHNIKQQSDKGVEWIKKSADSGFPDAQFVYGVLLFNGTDREKGKEILIQSAKSGNDKAVNYLIEQKIIKDKSELAQIKIMSEDLKNEIINAINDFNKGFGTNIKIEEALKNAKSFLGGEKT